MELFSIDVPNDTKKRIISDVCDENETVCYFMDGYEGGLVGYWVDPEGNVHAVYDYRMSIEYLMKKDNISLDDAIDYFSYNTERSLPYIEEEKRPIVIHLLGDEM